MKVITFAAKKGGVSKTTSSKIIAQLLGINHKVLLIDLDSQYALTSFFFEDSSIEGNTIYEVLRGSKLLKKAIYEITDNLHVIPCLENIKELRKWDRTGKELLLKKELRKISSSYDYVIIDTPADLDIETTLGLVAADIIIIPTRLETMDIRTITMTIEKFENEIKDDFNPSIQNIYILPTQYNFQNRTVNDLALEDLKEEFPDITLDITIPYSSDVSKHNMIGFENKDIDGLFPAYNLLVELIK